MPVRSSTPDPDRLRALVQELWRERGHTEGTIGNYLKVVQRYRSHCLRIGADEIEQLTRRSVDRYARAYARRRGLAASDFVEKAESALRGWARALASVGLQVPEWAPPKKPGPFDEILSRYREFRRRWRGVKESTVQRDCEVIRMFLRWSRRHRQPLASLTPTIIDRFLIERATTAGPVTLAAYYCTAIRPFLRFLHATKVIMADLSAHVVAPPTRRLVRPPRVPLWRDVRRVFRQIDRRTTIGKRDYAAFLLMATYGMGSAEVLGLCLDDVDWYAGTLRVVRPKTGVETILPLLGPVGRALASYLRASSGQRGRTRALFLRAIAPSGPCFYKALWDALRRYAIAAGVPVFGLHALRHAHACRQIEDAAPLKVISDIFGHDDPRSISAYARVATERLREVALPLP